MLLKIDFESETPIYMQLKNQLMEGMARKELVPGDSLPSVRQLAEDIGINMHTVNKVYSILKDDGFIVLDRRKGAVISNNAGAGSEYLSRLRNEIIPAAAEAYCRGVSKDEFLEICSSIFDSFKRGN